MADGIKIGNLDISAFKVGSDDCKVYLGDVKVYPSVETRVIATFNVNDTSNPTKIANRISGFSEIEIDGVVQPSVVSAYTFDTVGEHTVKYTLTDPTSIGYQAVASCGRLVEVIIDEGVTSIDSQAFNGDSKLEVIDFPSTLTSIGSYCFHNMGTSTCNITFRGLTPPTVNIGTNNRFTAANTNIYVPAEALETYKSTWTNIANIIHPIE